MLPKETTEFHTLEKSFQQALEQVKWNKLRYQFLKDFFQKIMKERKIDSIFYEVLAYFTHHAKLTITAGMSSTMQILLKMNTHQHMKNTKNEEWTKRRLFRSLQKIQKEQTLQQKLDALISDSYSFYANRPLEDDLTLVGLEFLNDY